MSAKFMVGYTSETEGITIAAIGDSTVEAASALVDQYGDGILVLLGHTQDELRNTAKSVEEAQGHETSQVLEAINDVVSTDESTAERAADDVGASEDADGGKGAEGSDRNAEAGPVCSICGTGITRDRATASRLTIGEERCADCGVV